MSDLGVLSHHYKASADLANDLNEAIIALKKEFYSLAGKEALDDNKLAEYRRRASAITRSVLVELLVATGQGEAEMQVERRVPASIIDRVRRRHKGEMIHFLDDLRETAESLKQIDTPLRERHIEILEELAQTAGLDTGEVFRKMWRHG